MDRAWEAGGRGGITSLETPLTQRARSSPGGSRRRAVRGRLFTPRTSSGPRGLPRVFLSPRGRTGRWLPGLGGGFWAPDFAIPPAFGPRSAGKTLALRGEQPGSAHPSQTAHCTGATSQPALRVGVSGWPRVWDPWWPRVWGRSSLAQQRCGV